MCSNVGEGGGANLGQIWMYFIAWYLSIVPGCYGNGKSDTSTDDLFSK